MPSASLGIPYIQTNLAVSSRSSEVSETWSPILPPDSPHIQELGKFAVDESNSKYGNNLEFQKVDSAWTWKVDEYTTKYRLYVEAIDSSARLHKYEAVVVETANGGLITNTLESFVEISP